MDDDPIQRFLSLMRADPMLERELGVTAEDSGVKPRLPVRRFVELGEQYGCRFTADELRTRLNAPSRSLSDEQLEHVVGGAGGSSVGGYFFEIDGDGISLHRGSGYNELSLDDTAGKEK